VGKRGGTATSQQKQNRGVQSGKESPKYQGEFHGDGRVYKKEEGVRTGSSGFNDQRGPFKTRELGGIELVCGGEKRIEETAEKHRSLKNGGGRGET